MGGEWECIVLWSRVLAFMSLKYFFSCLYFSLFVCFPIFLPAFLIVKPSLRLFVCLSVFIMTCLSCCVSVHVTYIPKHSVAALRASSIFVCLMPVYSILLGQRLLFQLLIRFSVCPDIRLLRGHSVILLFVQGAILPLMGCLPLKSFCGLWYDRRKSTWYS